MSNQNQNTQMYAKERLRRFKKATLFSPVFVCRCCHRKLFEHQVKEVDIMIFREQVEGEKLGFLTDVFPVNLQSKFYICKDAKLPCLVEESQNALPKWFES